MRSLSLLIALIALVCLGALSGPALPASAHAAFVRSEPAAGSHLDVPPAEIRIWFAEPLEASYTGADLLDAEGRPVPGATVSIAPGDDKELILTPPPDLPDGAYTVAWRTLSAADGHTLTGYFGFLVGAGTASGFVPAAEVAPNETARALTRGLALLGLACLLAIAPVTLAVLDPSARAVSVLGVALQSALRRYSLLAAVLALVTSVAALLAQAVAINPGSGIAAAVGQTLAQTRYGQLWQLRLLLLLLVTATTVAAFWGRATWRRPLLLVATVVGVLLPLPFSLLSHAAAAPMGTAAAITADALHLLAAAIWGGGLLLLVVVLLPAARFLPADARRALWRVALPRFSVIGLAAWGILALSGLYAAWLHVGTLEALRETPYGQSLLIKGALLLPVLALAAFHLMLGWRGASGVALRRIARTITVEALLVVAVFFVVGRLIGQEPARAVLASRQPTQLSLPLTFETPDGMRPGQLLVSPGSVGVNTFRIDVEEALPDGSEGVLRFTSSAHDMGTQELTLAQNGPNQFSAEGPELAMAGEWRIEALVRKIGAFSWKTQTSLRVSGTPPAAAESNPAPFFGPGGVAGMVTLAIGLVGLVAAALSRHAETRRHLGVAVIGALALAGGVGLLAGSRLPPLQPSSALAGAALTVPASPTAASTSTMANHAHATPGSVPASPTVLPGIGTPVSQGGIVVTVSAGTAQAGPTDVTIDIHKEDGTLISGARVVLFAEMTGMGQGGEGMAAQEVAPGRYVAREVPLTMAGDWLLKVRVSPKGEETRPIPVALTVS